MREGDNSLLDYDTSCTFICSVSGVLSSVARGVRVPYNSYLEFCGPSVNPPCLGRIFATLAHVSLTIETPLGTVLL
jgi:hypothetical protein